MSNVNKKEDKANADKAARKKKRKNEIILADGGPVIEWCEAIRHGYAQGRTPDSSNEKKS